jgi:hypothetical protein
MYPDYPSPVANRSTGPSRKLIFGVAGGVLALIIGIGLIIASSSGGSGQTMTRVVARQNALLGLAGSAHNKIVGAELRRINSDAILFMTSDGTALTVVMQAQGVKTVPKEVAALEADSTTAARLAQADSAGRFDETYITTLDQKIDAHQALLNEAHGKIKDEEARSTLKSTYEHLEDVQRQLQKL